MAEPSKDLQIVQQKRAPAARVVPGIYGAAAVFAMSCITLLGYLAHMAFTDNRTMVPGELDAPQELASDGARRSLPAPALRPRQADIDIAALIDEMDSAYARGLSGTGTMDAAATVLDRISKLVDSASPSGLKMVVAMQERFAAHALAAARAGRVEEARRLEQFSRSLAIAPPTSATRAPNTVTVAPLPRPRKADSVAAVPDSGTTPDQIGVPRTSAPDVRKQGAVASPHPEAGELPALAPVRVVLTVSREGSARANRAADIQKALLAAGVEVAGTVAAATEQSSPTIGYYFHSDSGAAAGVGRTLEPLLGTVIPGVLRARGILPQPGTIEVVIP